MKKIILALAIWCLFHSTQTFAVTDKIYKELSVFSKIIQIVDQAYVEEVDETKLIDGAIRGMLLSLDPHTVYFSSEIYKDFKSDTEGRFSGLGIEVTIKDDYVTVIAPLADTPAYRAGIRSGDKILKIDDHNTKGMSLADAVTLMRGPVGGRVKLTVYQQPHNTVREITLKREVIQPEGLAFEDLGDGYGYFRIKTFQEGIANDLRAAILDFEKKQNGDVNGLVLDLRGNPGGLLTEAVEMVNLFVKSGVIVSTKGRTRAQEILKADPQKVLDKKYALAVLIDSGSASASEIVAGALQDYKRAKLYGTKSYGKGSVQTIFPLDHGDAVKVTIARYFTPKNRMIDKKGIDPDVLLDQDAFRKTLAKDLDGQSKKKKKSKSEPETADESEDGGGPKFTFAAYLEFQKQEALRGLKKNP